MKLSLKSPKLAELIKQAQEEADAFIDAKAAEMKKQTEGVPIGVLRRLIENRAPGCPCKQALTALEDRA